MNARERQLATIRHEVPDMISVDAIAIENQGEIAEVLQIDRGAVLQRLGTDGRIVSAPYLGEIPEPAQAVIWKTPDILRRNQHSAFTLRYSRRGTG